MNTITTRLRCKLLNFYNGCLLIRSATGTAVIDVYRFNPETDKEPKMQQYTVELEKLPNDMFLDALIYIKGKLDGTLTFRRSCREGICGSCSMNINGVNCLPCITRITKKAIIRPLPSMYVIKDLVTDFQRFYDHYTKIRPYLLVKKEQQRPRKQFLQSIRDFGKVEVLYECILCGCCTHSCPAYWWHNPSFLGAAALMHAYRWIIDSRDDFAQERLDELKDGMNLFRCHTINNCTACCPKKINPSVAIASLKKMAIGVSKKEKPDLTKNDCNN